MAETTTHATPAAHVGSGRFVWHDLSTPDLAASKRFYSELLGWNYKESDMGGFPYAQIEANGESIGGMMPLPHEGVPAHWMGYVSVADVDGAFAVALAAGARKVVEPTDIPGTGRFAILMDPQGAVFAPFRYAHPEGPDGETPAVNTFCWDTLSATDRDAAAYGKVVGWKREPFGPNSVFVSGGLQQADMGPAQPGMPASWLAHLYVADLEASRKKVVELGGKVVVEQIDVPNVGAFSIIQDSVGAFVGLFSAPAR